MLVLELVEEVALVCELEEQVGVEHAVALYLATVLVLQSLVVLLPQEGELLLA